jgi:hypothetical protein
VFVYLRRYQKRKEYKSLLEKLEKRDCLKDMVNGSRIYKDSIRSSLVDLEFMLLVQDEDKYLSLLNKLMNIRLYNTWGCS